MRINKLTIKRSEWGRGMPNSQSGARRLLNDKGFKCCLGFFALACRVKREDILNCSDPEDIISVSVRKIPQLVNINVGAKENTPFSKAAILINDGCGMDEEEREKKLIELFKKEGIELNFID